MSPDIARWLREGNDPRVRPKALTLVGGRRDVIITSVDLGLCHYEGGCRTLTAISGLTWKDGELIFFLLYNEKDSVIHSFRHSVDIC